MGVVMADFGSLRRGRRGDEAQEVRDVDRRRIDRGSSKARDIELGC